jgi:D-glycero-D-manno-heptose 1,7-bisphosphate phosphatase
VNAVTENVPGAARSRGGWPYAPPTTCAAVFLDRDGVINRKQADGRYIASWAEFSFLPGALTALRLLAERNVTTIIVTNQRGVARVALTHDVLADIHQRMSVAINAAGGRIDAILVCDHDVARCDCRKPATGLFLRARDQFPAIAFDASTVIGDSASDLEAGSALGCRLVLVGGAARRRRELVRLDANGIRISGVAGTLLQAVRRYVLEPRPPATRTAP